MIQGLLLIFGFLLFFILSIILFVVVRVMNLFHRKKHTPTDKYHNVNDDYIVKDDGEDEFLENFLAIVSDPPLFQDRFDSEDFFK